MYPMLMNPPHSPMVAGASQSSMLSSSPLMTSNSPMLSNNSPLMQYSPYSDVLPTTILPPLGPNATSNQVPVDDSVSWGYPMNSAFSSEFCSNYGMCRECLDQKKNCEKILLFKIKKKKAWNLSELLKDILWYFNCQIWYHLFNFRFLVGIRIIVDDSRI